METDNFKTQFIMNALRDGWTVKRLGDQYKFSKNKRHFKNTNYENENYSLDFIKNYSPI